MNIFDFRRRLVDDYADYTSSFIRVREPKLRDFVQSQLDKGGLWPEPLNRPSTNIEECLEIYGLAGKELENGGW
jgi:hypothetical protein